MKHSILAAVALTSTLLCGLAVADDDCVDPIADWQPREALRQQLEQQGWTVKRIKVEDGCYEVRGVDGAGNKFKAKYSPASLQIRKLEIDFSHGGKASDHLEHGQKNKSGDPL